MVRGGGPGITFGSTPVVSVRAHVGGEEEVVEELVNPTGKNPSTPGHHRSYSTPGPPSSSSSRQWAGQQPPRTPPAFNQGNHGGYGHMSQMSPMGYQMPYGYPNGRERDYSRDRRDDYGRGGQREDYNRRGGGPSPRYDQGRERDRPYDSRDRYHRR